MRKILIVEDIDMNIDLLQQILEDDNNIFVARNGASAVEMADNERPDIILMDVSLPVLNGLDATRLIKAEARLAHIPIVAVTAHAMQGDRERALEAGCDDYLSKPIDEDELEAIIDRLAPA